MQRELRPEEEPKFEALVKAAFAHRRKTLVNSLRDEGYKQIEVVRALNQLGLSEAVRAEILSVAQFTALSRGFQAAERSERSEDVCGSQD